MSLESNPPLDLAERRQVLAPVVEFGGARVGMIRHILRRFQRAAVLQEHGDAGSPEGVIADAIRELGFRAALLDDAQHVAPGNPVSAKSMVLIQRLKHGRGGIGDARRFQIRVQILLGFVMQPDQLFLVALFEQPQPRALALQAVIAAFEFQDRADAREGVGHDGDDGPVAQSLDIGLDPHAPAVVPRNLHLARSGDGIKQLAHLIGLQDGRDADLSAESRPFDEEGRVIGNDLLDDQPVEQSAQRGQVLLDGRGGERLAFDIDGNVQRPDRMQLQLVPLTPAAELSHRLHIGRARVFVANRGGEEFEEMLAGFFAGACDEGRHGKRPR